jgi:hypothetical protein
MAVEKYIINKTKIIITTNSSLVNSFRLMIIGIDTMRNISPINENILISIKTFLISGEKEERSS